MVNPYQKKSPHFLGGWGGGGIKKNSHRLSQSKFSNGDVIKGFVYRSLPDFLLGVKNACHIVVYL